uniref:sialidase family protein n=1 Tax=Nosocomiicoccus ampullae TaxID=489910 RepID=UPI00082B9DD0|nr:sialidase family protein [Nosocomiicoccus ampullae]
MKLNRTGSIWDRKERININDNWDMIEGSVGSVDTLVSKSETILEEAKKINNENKDVQKQIDNLILSDGESDAEVIQARTDLNGYTHDVLKQRLDYDTSRLDKTELDNFNTNTFLEMPENYLEIPSAIGSSLTTHPSVIDFLEEFGIATWNGYRYWMAHTPYPGTQNENPSIAASNDNVNWVLPKGAPNPVIGAPVSPAYNSDTELIYLPAVNKLRIYYREANNPDGSVVIYYIESTDGSNWTAPVVSLKTTERQVLSPSIVPAPNNRWFMYCVESETTIHRRESSDGITWSNPDAITQPWDNWSAWHIGVTRDTSGTYHMLGSTWADSASGEGTQFRPIVYASSANGWHWIANEKPQLIPTGWAGGYLYRPHFIVDESKGLKDGMPYVKVWFSAAQDAVAAGWHIGYSEGYLMPGDTLNASATSANIKRKRVGEYFKLFASNIIAPFARIGRLKTKRIELESDYSQPIIEMRDGRPGKNGNNYVRIEYVGGKDSEVRMFLSFFNDDELSTKE